MPPSTLPAPALLMVSGIISALLNYSGQTAEAEKTLHNRLIETLAATFPQIEFFRLATSDPVVKKMVDGLTPEKFSELFLPYVTELLPTLSVEEINGFAAHLYQGPKQLRLLAPDAHRTATTALIFNHLIPEIAVHHFTRLGPVSCQMGTASIRLDPNALNKYRHEVLQLAGLSPAEAQALTLDQLFTRVTQAAVRGLTSQESERVFDQARKLVGEEGVRGVTPECEAYLTQLFQPKSAGVSPPASPSIAPPEIRTDERRMLDFDKSFIHDGVRYFPLSVAAPVIQAPRSTLMHWINKKTKFDGRPLETYYFAPANQYFISEDAIKRATQRFVKWPSQEPAGKVTLGDTDDKSGYIGLTDAARTVGVDHHTMWRWATKGTAPTEKPLDVIKCPASDQFYIREKDVSVLKKHVPRSGLHAGRRAHSTPKLG